MSFDLGVWYSDTGMDDAEAAAFYGHIYRDWVVIQRRPEFDEFLAELVARFPDLRSPSVPAISADQVPHSLLIAVDEIGARRPPQEELEALRGHEPAPENSPWAATLGPMGSTIALSIVWSRVEQTAPAVYDLAARHCLIVYNPQSSVVTVPSAVSRKGAAERLQARLSLRIDGRAPTLDALLTMDGRIVRQTRLATRAEAHAQAREAAIRNRLAFYEVADPTSLAQAYQWEDVSHLDLEEASHHEAGFEGDLARFARSRGWKLMRPVLRNPEG